jgi:hypothetical protein
LPGVGTEKRQEKGVALRCARLGIL